MAAVDQNALADYLKEARSFDYDQRLAAERSKRIAWTVAGVASVLAIAAVSAVAALAPLKEVAPFVIRVDNATGVPEVMTALSDGQETYDEAVTRYFLARYVRVREGYTYAERESIYHEVSLTSAPDVTERFGEYFNASNPQSPQYLYGKDVKAEIQVRSLSFLSDGLAQVRFARVVHNAREDSVTKTLWVATIEYAFDPEAQITTEDRVINPLGFIVKNYRADPEVSQ